MKPTTITPYCWCKADGLGGLFVRKNEEITAEDIKAGEWKPLFEQATPSEEWVFVREGGLPPVNEHVIAGYWYQDFWLKDAPWVFSTGVCYVYKVPVCDSFPEGLRWHTHGCAHSDITVWKQMGKLPVRPDY